MRRRQLPQLLQRRSRQSRGNTCFSWRSFCNFLTVRGDARTCQPATPNLAGPATHRSADDHQYRQDCPFMMYVTVPRTLRESCCQWSRPCWPPPPVAPGAMSHSHAYDGYSRQLLKVQACAAMRLQSLSTHPHALLCCTPTLLHTQRPAQGATSSRRLQQHLHAAACVQPFQEGNSRHALVAISSRPAHPRHRAYGVLLPGHTYASSFWIQQADKPCFTDVRAVRERGGTC